MENNKLKYLIFLLLITNYYAQFCEFHPLDPIACVEIKDLACYYDLKDNTCSALRNTNFGCESNLNKLSCLQQITNPKNEEVLCLFATRCQYIKEINLSHFGCNNNLNKNACLKVSNEQCFWNDELIQCQKLENLDLTKESCETIITKSVTANVCSSLQYKCKNTGAEGNYKCQTINDEELKTLKCSQYGLSESGCISIITEGEQCVFNDGKCKYTNEVQNINCDMMFNKQGCLSISDTKVKCQWKQNKCQEYLFENENNCLYIQDVNNSTCRFSMSKCRYDVQNQQCVGFSVQQANQIKCNDPGLSRVGCFAITSQACTFRNGYCQELTESDLSFYNCDMELNQYACINIKTEFQYCVWEKEQCSKTNINQSYSCSSNAINNGNYCQAISNLKDGCKFSQTGCLLSSPNDTCDTPYLNLLGCVSITKNKETCQWQNGQCKRIEIKQKKTTCKSLLFANAESCQQIYEDDSLGCYFDKEKSQCVQLIISVSENEQDYDILQEYQQSQEILNKLQCSIQNQGINKSACASITTEGQACRWYQEKCQYVKNAASIQTVPCQILQYSNFRLCALVTFQKEICRFSETVRGCVNTSKKNMTCDEIGLNAYGCSQGQGACYYSQSVGRCLSLDMNDETQITLLDGFVCIASSPTKPICLAIQTKRQLCQYLITSDKCSEIIVVRNDPCLKFSGVNLLVNSNVCAAINMDDPDTQNQGYCQYQQETNQCMQKLDGCKTKCCTEVKGINTHSCSKYSSVMQGDYCHFLENKCLELNAELVNIKDPSAVSEYYNSNQFKCEQLNKNSCWMINWSVTQKCFYTGTLCINVNLSKYKNFEIFTKQPSQVNEYVCLAIEAIAAQGAKQKYFLFDQQTKLCSPQIFANGFTYNKCEDAKGNRNICLRYTTNSYCKWDSVNLKCITIPDYEFASINTCNYNQNIKACKENQNVACQFQYDSDKCIVAPTNVNCNSFDNTGPISQMVCRKITKNEQMCDFDPSYFKCKVTNRQYSSCDVGTANINACFKLTQKLCRWDSETSSCYENQQNINELRCLDNLNQKLCVLVSKNGESCFWNNNVGQCQKMNSITSQNFQLLNSQNLYNEQACLMITGDGYYYDANTNKCIKITIKDDNYLKCNEYKMNEYKMNEYACLYYTKGSNCYFDNTIVPPQCKEFTEKQSICNSNYLINIEVCMQILKQCYFDIYTLRCLDAEIDVSTTCTELKNKFSKGQIINRQGCISVDSEIKDTFGPKQCYDNQEFGQQCNFEKYCYFDIKTYSCEVLTTIIHYFDLQKYVCVSNEIKECKINQNQFDAGSDCDYTVKMIDGEEYKGDDQDILPGRCSKTNQYCTDSCPNYFYPSATMDATGKVNNGTSQTQTCEKICVKKGLTNNNCQSDSDCSGIQFATRSENSKPNYQWCYYKGCNRDGSYCQNTCQNYGNFTQSCTLLSCNGHSGCICYTTQQYGCSTDYNCPQPFPYYANFYYKKCLAREICKNQPGCLFVIKKFDKCDKNYSKAICLELVSEGCGFDLSLGGCFQVKGNEDKIPNCQSINTDCKISLNSQAICQLGDIVVQPGDSCLSLQKQIQTCKPLLIYNPPFKCLDIKKEDAQPILCAMASDDCLYNNGQCVTTTNPNTCDKSFSSTICLKNKCDYDATGYCQKSPDPLPVFNEYAQCYQVNKLTRNIQLNCAKVQQACIYTVQCEDATNSKCDDLIGYYVSEFACTNCKEYPVYYSDYLCRPLSKVQYIYSCDKLNRLGCLQNSRGINCMWYEKKCSYSNDRKQNCQLYNFDLCKLNDECWFDTDINQCTNYDSTKGDCYKLFNEKTCLQSMKQSCIWQNSECIVNTTKDFNKCSSLNKYACLMLSTLPCYWDNSNNQCYDFQQNQSQCEFDKSPSSYMFYNKNVCKKITDTVSCIQDQYFKCRKVIVTDKINCDTNGLNKHGCFYQTTQECQFKNDQCQQAIKPIKDCNQELSKVSCLNSTDKCKFTSKCEQYTETNQQKVLSDSNYSQSVCLIFDQVENFQLSLIYNKNINKCVDISSSQPFLYDCTIPGTNKYTCLTKTLVPCKYQDGICLSVERTELSRYQCIKELNAYGCMQMLAKCKFFNYQCLPLDKDDTCTKLIEDKSIVNSNICSQTTDVACKYNDITKTCQLAQDKEKCETLGLNETGCIQNTSGKYCKFYKNSCQPSFESVRCSEKVNKDKCLSIRTAGNYCTFDKKCWWASGSDKCIKNYQTNPLTCSRAYDMACMYDKISKTCVKFDILLSGDQQANYNWDNNISFNQLACVQYNLNSVKTQWKNNSCQLVTDIELNYLKCYDPINLYTCVNILTPYQFCRYYNNYCYKRELESFNGYCQSIININKGDFCTRTADVACSYDPIRYQCREVLQQDDIICDQNPEKIGYNELACKRNQKNCIFTVLSKGYGQCVKLDPSVYYYCNNANNYQNCKTVMNQGCQFTDKCVAIEELQYQQLNCNDAINLKGCILISKQNQYCRYNQNQCQNVTFKQLKYQTCESIKNINNLNECEQPQDVPCRFRPQTSSCVQITKTDDKFGCQRGINRLACVNPKITNYSCKFFKYCYELLFYSNTKFCKYAYTIDQCLLQTEILCQWKDNKCVDYIEEGQQSCNQLQNISRQACYNLNNLNQNSICIFDVEQFKCQEIIPQNCEDVQTNQQCTQVLNQPCYWDTLNEECKIKIKQTSDTCQSITQISGNKIACLNVSQQGQHCKFEANQCRVSYIDSNINDCENNINRIACLHQTKRQCFWNETVEQLSYGQCQNLILDNVNECNKNLSYLSCISVTKQGLRCQWVNKECQTIQNNNNRIFTIYDLSLVNQNSCALVNNGDIVIYDTQNKLCKIVDDIESIICQPSLPGLNKDGCLISKLQPCKWSKDDLTCYSLIQQQEKGKSQLIPMTSCYIEDVNQKACTTIEIYLPCGAIQNGCDKVDLDKVDCDYPGLNKYSCLNITKHPCKWTKDIEGDLYHCEKYEPYTKCESLPELINPYVCSIIQNEPCVYDLDKKTCIKPIKNYLDCKILGSNGVACSMYENCIFLNGICQKYEKQMNLECNQANKANVNVCKQIFIDRCKYNPLQYGCMNSQLTDPCSTLGINQLGCLTLEDCIWYNNSCFCKKMLEKYPKCHEIQNLEQCKNNDNCLPNISETTTNINIPTLYEQNYGKCINRTCDYYESNCDGKIIQNKLCYLNKEGQCKEASECKDILNPINECLNYKFNKPCQNKNHKNGIICQDLDICENLNKTQCLLYPNLCEFTTSCITKACRHYHNELSCINTKVCNWKDNICYDQKPCQEITKIEECILSQYNGIKCGSIQKYRKEEQFCTDIPCRYLKETFTQCIGAKVNTDICVLLPDQTCVSCQEIMDPCICLKYEEFCSLNQNNSKCEPKTCENHLKENCPKSHCQFELVIGICVSQCSYIYHKKQCETQKHCKWNLDQVVCDPLNINEREKPDPLKGDPNYQTIIFYSIGYILINL